MTNEPTHLFLKPTFSFFQKQLVFRCFSVNNIFSVAFFVWSWDCLSACWAFCRLEQKFPWKDKYFPLWLEFSRNESEFALSRLSVCFCFIETSSKFHSPCCWRWHQVEGGSEKWFKVQRISRCPSLFHETTRNVQIAARQVHAIQSSVL